MNSVCFYMLSLVLLFCNFMCVEITLGKGAQSLTPAMSTHLTEATKSHRAQYTVARLLSNRGGRLPFEMFGDVYSVEYDYDYVSGGVLSPIEPFMSVSKLDMMGFLQLREKHDILRIEAMRTKHSKLTEAFLLRYEKELTEARFDALSVSHMSRFIYYYSNHPSDTKEFNSAVTLFDATLINDSWVRAPLESFLKQNFPERLLQHTRPIAFIELSSAYKNSSLDADSSNFNLLLREVGTYIDRYVQNGYQVIVRVLTSRTGRALFCSSRYGFTEERHFIEKDTGAELYILKIDGAKLVEKFGSKRTAIPYYEFPPDPLWEYNNFLNEELHVPPQLLADARSIRIASRAALVDCAKIIMSPLDIRGIVSNLVPTLPLERRISEGKISSLLE